MIRNILIPNSRRNKCYHSKQQESKQEASNPIAFQEMQFWRISDIVRICTFLLWAGSFDGSSHLLFLLFVFKEGRLNLFQGFTRQSVSLIKFRNGDPKESVELLQSWGEGNQLMERDRVPDWTSGNSKVADCGPKLQFKTQHTKHWLFWKPLWTRRLPCT